MQLRGEIISGSFEMALVQAEPELGDKGANLGRMKEFVEGTEANLFLEVYPTG
ncbi:MAG: hypothetical protein V3U30_04750 [Thermoplasmata archaeon]